MTTFSTRFGLWLPERPDSTAKLRQAIAANAAICDTYLDGPLVNTLPTTGLVDGQIVYYQNTAMATAGAVWRFRYRKFLIDGTTPNPNTSKWEHVGGSRLSAEGTTSAATITVPLAGDYEITSGGAGTVISGTSGGTYLITYTTSGTGVTSSAPVASPKDLTVGGEATHLRTGIAASTVLTLSITSASTFTATNCYHAIRPIRVG